MIIKKNKKIEFYNIYKEFLKENKFREMKNDIHHGLSRLDHISRVARISFVLSKTLKLDYKSATRGALLHDFFTSEDMKKENFHKYLIDHPKIACKNAKKYFKINSKEKDIIEKHMFPVTLKLPKYKESYVVSLADKVASIYEFFKYQVNMTTNLFIILFINILR